VGVSIDATKLRKVYFYANNQRLSSATTNDSVVSGAHEGENDPINPNLVLYMYG